MTKKEIEAFVTKLGFNLTNGKSEHWTLEIEKYKVGIDLKGDNISKWNIDYGNDIKVHN